MRCPYRKITKIMKGEGAVIRTFKESYAECQGKECPMHIEGKDGQTYCAKAEKLKAETFPLMLVKKEKDDI